MLGLFKKKLKEVINKISSKFEGKNKNNDNLEGKEEVQKREELEPEEEKPEEVKEKELEEKKVEGEEIEEVKEEKSGEEKLKKEKPEEVKEEETEEKEEKPKEGKFKEEINKGKSKEEKPEEVKGKEPEEKSEEEKLEEKEVEEGIDEEKSEREKEKPKEEKPEKIKGKESEEEVNKEKSEEEKSEEEKPEKIKRKESEEGINEEKSKGDKEKSKEEKPEEKLEKLRKGIEKKLPYVEEEVGMMEKGPSKEEIEEEIEKELENEEKKEEVKEEAENQSKKKEGFFKGFIKKITKKITEKKITEGDFSSVVDDLKITLLQNDVAFEVVNKIIDDMKKDLIGKSVKRGKIQNIIIESLRKSLLDILKQKWIDLEEIIKKSKSESRPALIVFIGFNGVGKTTTLAKLGFMLKSKGYKVLFAAGDTFRAASIEQLEFHSKMLDIPIVKHTYGSDSAAVIFDAMKHAKSSGYDVVLADTAGRSHSNVNLMDELKKVIRVNKPDFKIFVVDSLTGNDAVEQAKKFDEAVNIDGIILTKFDVNDRGGAALSVGYITKKPILYIGVGQDYHDIMKFDPEFIVNEILSI